MFPLAEKLARRIGIAAGSAAIAVAAISPAQAAAPTWIKATFAGTATDSNTGYVTSFSDWSFEIYAYPYTTTGSGVNTVYSALQSSAKNSVGYNPPIFGAETFVGTSFIPSSGYNWWAQPNITQPGNQDQLIFGPNPSTGDNFTMNTGRATTPGSGVRFQRRSANGNPLSTPFVDYISLYGSTLSSSSSSQTDIAFGSNNGTISSLISSAMSTSPVTFYCLDTANSCGGLLQTSSEGYQDLTWTSVTFQTIQGTPAPLPLLGALSAFRYSRKLRRTLRQAGSK